MTRRVAGVAPAVVLPALLLSSCGSRDATMQATSSAMSSAASSASSMVSSAASAAASAAATPRGAKVATTDLPAIVADRTFRGNSEGKPYAEYYAPDGTLRGKAGDEAYTGTWKVTGEQLCFTYPKNNETDCYAVFKDGDAVTWVDTNGQLVEATYVQGNPDKL